MRARKTVTDLPAQWPGTDPPAVISVRHEHRERVDQQRHPAAARGGRPARGPRGHRVAVRAHHVDVHIGGLGLHRLSDHQPGWKVPGVHAHDVDAGE